MRLSMKISKNFISDMSIEELEIAGIDQYAPFLVQQLH